MKRPLLLTMILAISMLAGAQKISRVEPLSWWTDMKLPLTLMFQGEDLQDAEVTVQKQVKKNKFAPTEGIQIKGREHLRPTVFVSLSVKKRIRPLCTIQFMG